MLFYFLGKIGIERVDYKPLTDWLNALNQKATF